MVDREDNLNLVFPFCHLQLLRLVRSGLREERLDLGLMHHRDLNDRGQLDRLLQLVDLDLRALTLGLDLRARC